jgi:hypothetical protein
MTTKRLDGDPLEDVDNGPKVLTLINRFTEEYGKMIEGRFVQ